jgi:hypothetical protein
MRSEFKIALLAALLCASTSCDKSDKARTRMDTNQNYSLCPKADDARARLYPLINDFAKRYGARLVDRGAGAQKELSGMESGKDILGSTGGDPILLTVEKTDEFRVSLTNLGLREKVALSVRYWRPGERDSRIAALIDDIGRFWSIQRVEGGVTDDPSCAPAL